MKEAIGYLQACYRSRAYRIYILNTPFMISKFLWPIAKLVLDQNTIDKVNIASGATHENMKKHINSHNYETQFGGEVPDLTTEFWYMTLTA
jgi:CRAL/TRIO domain